MTEKLEQNQHAERVHHPISPSTLAMCEACPCYEGRSGTASEKAARGTLQHEAVELGEDSDFLEDHEALAVADCVAFCENLIKTRYKGKPGHDLTEPYLPIDDREVKSAGIIFKGSTAGYCDRLIVSKCGKFADIVDWKFGMFQVTDAESNIQGIAYLLGAVKKFPTLESVTVHFVAPHRDEIDFHTFTKDSFKWNYNRVVRVVKAAARGRNQVARGDFSSATPDQTACLFCKHAATCPKLTAKCIEIGMKRAPLEFPADLDAKKVSDPANAGVGLRLAAVVKGWAEEYRGFITSKTIDELDYVPEGYILSTGQRRQIISVRGIREIAAQRYSLTEEELDSASDIALGKLEKLIAAKLPRGSKTAAVEEFSEALEEAGYTEKGVPYGFLKMAKGAKTKIEGTTEEA